MIAVKDSWWMKKQTSRLPNIQGRVDDLLRHQSSTDRLLPKKRFLSNNPLRAPSLGKKFRDYPLTQAW
jgi:hypothetical protein